MFVVDMHCDSLLTVDAEHGLQNRYNFSTRYPQLQFTAMFQKNADVPAEERRRKLMHRFDVYLAETQRLGMIRVDSRQTLDEAIAVGKHCALFAVEGGGGLFADSPELETLARAGLRVMGLAWDDSELASCAFHNEADFGLTEEGVAMAFRLSQLGILPDVSHLSDNAIDDLFGTIPGTVLATHSNFRAVRNVHRNLLDEHAKEIAARGGVIGLNLCPHFLAEGNATLDDLLRQIDYGLSLVGEDAIGFGFDLDGIDSYPSPLDESESIHDRVIDLLLSHYPARTVEKIAGENVLNVLKRTLK